MQDKSMKGQECKHKPILCQEGWCNECQVNIDWMGHQRTMGRASLVTQWIIDFEKEQGDSVEILKKQILMKRTYVFVESSFGSREKKMQMQSMVNAYDVVLKLIKDIGGKE